jgi:hypothetical protein
MRRWFPEVRYRRAAPSLLLLIATFCLISWAASPAFAIWLPWASEEDKVKKALTDVFQALVTNDRRTLSDLVKGNASQRFIDQEREQIRNLAVKQYQCRVLRMNIDQVQKAWAFVEYNKIATLADGKQLTTAGSSVFRKIDGDWKLLTGVRGKLGAARKQAEARNRGAGGEAEEATSGEIPLPSPVAVGRDGS